MSIGIPCVAWIVSLRYRVTRYMMFYCKVYNWYMCPATHAHWHGSDKKCVIADAKCWT
jgi:hypothetical protein